MSNSADNTTGSDSPDDSGEDVLDLTEEVPPGQKAADSSPGHSDSGGLEGAETAESGPTVNSSEDEQETPSAAVVSPRETIESDPAGDADSGSSAPPGSRETLPSGVDPADA